jgi:hypothetical protein
MEIFTCEWVTRIFLLSFRLFGIPLEANRARKNPSKEKNKNDSIPISIRKKRRTETQKKKEGNRTKKNPQARDIQLF